jgi:hypothetical protein
VDGNYCALRRERERMERCVCGCGICFISSKRGRGEGEKDLISNYYFRERPPVEK